MNRYNDNFDLLASLLCIAFAIGILFLTMIGTNSCSSHNWNDGVCPHCEVRYELRAASQGLKYYVCPDCGQEVNRY